MNIYEEQEKWCGAINNLNESKNIRFCLIGEEEYDEDDEKNDGAGWGENTCYSFDESYLEKIGIYGIEDITNDDVKNMYQYAKAHKADKGKDCFYANLCSLLDMNIIPSTQSKVILYFSDYGDEAPIEVKKIGSRSEVKTGNPIFVAFDDEYSY